MSPRFGGGDWDAHPSDYEADQAAEPECTCDDRVGETVCHDIRYEPHYVGCPRWRTPLTVVPLPLGKPRPTWDEYGLDLARAVAARADCTRRRVGAVILDAEHRVVSTGYNGAPAGQPGCLSDGACPRGQLSYEQQPGMVGYDLAKGRCDALHAEMNAVIYAGRDRSAGATLYCTDQPCHMCTLVIAAAGITRVVVV